MNLLIRKHNPGPTRILDGEFGLPIFARYASDSTPQMLPIQSLDILDFKRLDIQLVQS